MVTMTLDGRRQARTAEAPIIARIARLFAATVLALVLASAAGMAANAGIIDAGQARSMAEAGRLTIIDIRRPDEWRATGLPKGAERATIQFGRGDGRFLARIRELTAGHDDAPIAFICAQGVRSAYAATLLRTHGYKRVYDISEGMLGSKAGPGWLQRRLPISTCDNC